MGYPKAMALPSYSTEPDAPAPIPLPVSDPSLHLDREQSLVAFQRRVLEEARDSSSPLLERVKFLSILFSNLDEFFMVRVAALKQKLASNAPENVAESLDRIRADVKKLNQEAYGTWQELLLEIQQAGIDLRDYSDLNERERRHAQAYFHEVVYPVLTPLAVDRGRPFPHISNLSLNLAVKVRDARGVHFARVKIPDTLPQIVIVGPANKLGLHVPASTQGGLHGQPPMIWLEQLVAANLDVLFPGLEIVEAAPFRATRDADVAIQELESDDLLETVEEAIWQRRFRAVVRLQVSRNIPADMLDTLIDNLEVDRRDVDYVEGPLDLSRLRALSSLERPELKDAPISPHIPLGLHAKKFDEDIFSTIRREDVLLHHPFDSFQPVVEFLRRAAADPDVLAIKMTLYRVGRNSPVVEALVNAIENGKQVAVMVELKARFDEESNIEWAKALEAEGVHVVYGLVGLKVHSKVALVVRREGERIRRYVHLGTGNYNPSTARVYTDLSLFTADEQIGADVSGLFNYVTGFSAKHSFRKLLVAPINLRSGLETKIRREIEHARQGRPAQLIFKMNALEDVAMIHLLYEASQAGVRVDLIVRGICCLRPGVPGVSENIHVRSVVGRFLEHSRIYYFANGGPAEVYLGSADLMGRNLDNRVEILFPVDHRKHIALLRENILQTYLNDNRSARDMRSDGSYRWDRTAEPAIDSQAQFMSAMRS